MKAVLHLFTAIGVIVTALHIGASLGVGHFALIYSGKPINCGTHGSTGAKP